MAAHNRQSTAVAQTLLIELTALQRRLRGAIPWIYPLRMVGLGDMDTGSPEWSESNIAV